MDKELNESAADNLNMIVTDLKELTRRIDGVGLYNGLMGICICYFLLFEITQIKKYKNIAKRLLNRIQETIPAVDDFGFGKGLAGVGWGVEWLVQNKFIKANTDLILEELDDDLYRKVLYSKDTDLSLSSGSTGKALYFLARLQAKNPNKLRYRYVCNLECVVLLSDEVSERLLNEDSGVIYKNKTEIGDTEFVEIAHGLILMLLLKQKRINTETATQTIQSVILFFENYLLWLNMEKVLPERKPGFLHLVFAYQVAGEILGKERFSLESLAVNQYLKHLNYISDKDSANVKETGQIAGITIEAYINQFDNDVLRILREINAIKNTTYFYEAFMLNVT